MAEDQNYFAPRIDLGVIVVVIFSGGDAIAGECDGPHGFAIGTEIEREEIALFAEIADALRDDEFEFVIGSELRVSSDRKRLKIAAADWFEARGVKLVGDISCGFFEFGRTGHSALELVGRKVFDVIEILVGLNLVVGCLDKGDGKREV